MAAGAARRTETRTRRAAPEGDPLIATKLLAPDSPGWAVQRPRITTLVADRVRGYPLTVVTGPVGAGKTMALAQWVATEQAPVAWISLDDYHNRPGVFLSYLVAALHGAGVHVPRVPRGARGRAAEDLFLLRLAAALAGQDAPVTLVLDDFHVITEPRVPNVLEFLVRNVGPGLRLVVSSRSHSPIPLHRYRLSGQLGEIRVTDLAFTVDEAAMLLSGHDCTVSAHSLECLTRQTEGWPAGLRLAAISMTTLPDPDRYVADLTTGDSALTGFLAEEVLETSPPRVRELLLGTAVLERVDPAAAAELTGDDDAWRVLQALAADDMFVEATDGGYRYHTLFAHMLRRVLTRESPDRVASSHRTAARWHHRNGHLAEAVRHAARAEDWRLAAGMVVEDLAIGELLEPTGGPSLADELAGMPRGETWAEPAPHLVCGALLASAGQVGSALAELDAAEEILGQRPVTEPTPEPTPEPTAEPAPETAPETAAARLAAAMIRFAVARRSGNLDAAADAAAVAEVLVDELPSGPKLRARVLRARGTVQLWAGRVEEAVRAFDSATAEAAAPGCDDERAACLGRLALAEALRGRLRRAATLAEQAAPPCTHPRCAEPAALTALAWVHLQHHEQQQARDLLKQANAALAANPDKLLEAIACLTAAYSALAEGRDATAVQAVGRARSGWRVPVWLAGELGLVESRARRGAVPTRAGLDDVEALLAAHDTVPDRLRLQAWLVDAQLGYRGGDGARGRRSLGRALRLAEREQLRLPFVLDRQWIEPVLRRDPQLAEAVHQLLQPAAAHHPPPSAPRVDESVVAAVETLTEREREVLRRISGMLTTAEIATELYISTNTVKSHVKNVCRKLSATHRGEAVRRARQLQLI